MSVTDQASGAGDGKAQAAKSDTEEGAQGAQGTDTGTGEGERQERTADELQADLERIQQELKDARAEAAKHRVRKNELEQAAQAAQQAGMSEVERLTQERDTLATELTELREFKSSRELADAATTVAERLGYKRPNKAHRYVDAASVRDEEGGIDTKKLEKALQAELADSPELGNGGGGDGGGGTRRAAKAGDMNTVIRQAAGRGQ